MTTPTPRTIRLTQAKVLLDLERLAPAERLTASVNVLVALEQVRAVRAGAVLDLRRGDRRRPPLTWAAIGDLVGQSRQTIEQWAKQYR